MLEKYFRFILVHLPQDNDVVMSNTIRSRWIAEGKDGYAYLMTKGRDRWVRKHVRCLFADREALR